MSAFSIGKASNAKLAYHAPGAVKQAGAEVFDTISPRYGRAKFTAEGGVKVNNTRGLADWEFYAPRPDPIQVELATNMELRARILKRLSKPNIVTLASPRLIRPGSTVQKIGDSLVFKTVKFSK